MSWNSIEISNLKEIFSKPKEELEQHINEYNKNVKELNLKIKKIFNFISVNDGENNIFERNLMLEMPILNRLMRTPLGYNSAMFIPDFKTAVNLSLLTGCSTAFMSATPFRMVIFKDFIEKMTDIGILFIIAHEANHFARKHFVRKQHRKIQLWNIATDLLINYKLTNEKIRNIKNKFSSKYVLEITNYDIFKKEFHQEMQFFNYIGNKNIPEELKGTKQDMSDWYKKYNVDKNNEEAIYFLLEKDGISIETEDHMQDGLNAYNKGKSITTHDLYKDIFGEYSDEMLKELEKTLNEFGFPKNKAEEDGQKQNNKEMFNDFKRQWEKLSKKIGSGHSEIDEILQREKDIEAKGKFVANIRASITKKSSYGKWERTTEITRFSKQTKVPSVANLIGFENQLKFLKKEQVIPTFRALTILDTSGSVSIEEISKQYLNEISNLINNYNFELTVVSADTQSIENSRFVINKENFDLYDKNGFPISGGGGTNMLNPLAKELVFSDEDYDVVIILSDGGYILFSKDELMKSIEGYHSELLKDNKKSKAIKRMNKKKVNNKYKFPTIILLNTQEMINKDNLNTFSKNELQEYLLDEEFCAKIYSS